MRHPSAFFIALMFAAMLTACGTANEDGASATSAPAEPVAAVPTTAAPSPSGAPPSSPEPTPSDSSPSDSTPSAMTLPYSGDEDLADYWTGYADSMVNLSVRGAPSGLDMADPSSFATSTCQTIWSSGLGDTNNPETKSGWMAGCADAQFSAYEFGVRYFPDGEDGFRLAVESCGRTILTPANVSPVQSLEESASMTVDLMTATANCILQQNPNFVCSEMGASSYVCSDAQDSLNYVDLLGDEYLALLLMQLPL